MPKVLLLDDDVTIVSLLQTLLELEGVQVLHFNGEGKPDEILDVFHREKPDLVLLDVHLRHTSGFDLLHLVRQDEGLESVRILMSSGMELSSKCAQEGADGFILKPYMPDELVKKIRITLSA